jgi:hypothetical protein
MFTKLFGQPGLTAGRALTLGKNKTEKVFQMGFITNTQRAVNFKKKH